MFHVKENVAGATIGHIFPVNVSSFAPNSGNIKFLIANQQDVADEIAIGTIAIFNAVKKSYYYNRIIVLTTYSRLLHDCRT